jgi:hypothetical protein
MTNNIPQKLFIWLFQRIPQNTVQINIFTNFHGNRFRYSVMENILPVEKKEGDTETPPNADKDQFLDWR